VAKKHKPVSYASVKNRLEFTSGEYLFNTRCQACHSLATAGGEGIGPGLLGVVAKRDRAWLTRWLKQPDQMLAEQDPLALALFRQYRQLPMPNLGLSDGDVAALIEYMAAAGPAARALPPAAD
jgi:protein SCO1/2